MSERFFEQLQIAEKLGREKGLLLIHICILGILHVRDGFVSERMLAKLTGVSAEAVLYRLERLEGYGYVQRLRGVADRRKVYAKLTDAGREFIHFINESIVKI